MRPRRILVLQTGRFEHFLAASIAVAKRYPSAELAAFVSQADLDRVRICGQFVGVHPLSSPQALSAVSMEAGQRPDLCVVPFEDRFGIRYWTFRSFPIRWMIQRVAAYNRLGHFQEWNWFGWILHSLLACGGGRLAQAVLPGALRVWLYIRRFADLIALFGLASLALLLCALKSIGLHPLTSRYRKLTSQKSQRVVLFIPSLGLGGAQRQLISFLKHLDRARWTPEVVTLDTTDKFFAQLVQELNVPILYLDPHKTLWKFGIICQLIRHLYDNPCVVLHSWLHYAVAFGAVAGSIAGIPVVVGSFRSERPSRFPWFYPKWQRTIDVLTGPMSTCFIANSNAVREENRRWAFIPRQKLITIYNGIDTEECLRVEDAQRARMKRELQIELGASIVGIVGRLYPEKDHISFLKAAKLVSLARPETYFLIIGDGPCRRELEVETKLLGLSDRVRMLGERKDVLALIQLLDVFVLTSTSEGFPNVLLEANLAGIPVVTTAAGGAVEVVIDGRTGFVVPCGDIEAIARRTLELLGNEGLRGRFAEAARDRVKAFFSADKVASKIEACYLG